ncbi:MAG TPA: sigma-70 family RNA polymerase sigma factor [Thermodesulfobacteriota bacterium]|nr:sigma-70 family RNA polymerase sigma factor [Thermodesulfobacteriota bacterium]
MANLISEIAEGSESALSTLYDLTNRLVFGLALRILSDVAEAEEVTLDVFMHVWDRAADYDPGRSTPSTWLLMLTRSRAIDRLRSGAKQTLLEDLSDTDVSSPEGDPEEKALFAEKREIVRNALSSLTPQQRKPIELAYFYGLTQSEISKRLGQPLGTVKSSIRLGMVKLRELLGLLEEGEE